LNNFSDKIYPAFFANPLARNGSQGLLLDFCAANWLCWDAPRAGAKINCMRIRTFLVLVLVFFGLALAVGRVSIGARWPERVDVSYALSLTFMAAGGLTAVVSLFILLQRGLGGQGLDQSLPLIIALLGGLLLYQINWGVALALGMIGTAAIIMHYLGKGPRSS
jgi:hypothetical protein